MAVKATLVHDDGKVDLVIGVSRGNVERLIDDKPMLIEVPSPISGNVIIIFAETEADLYSLLRPMFGPNTKLSIDPRLPVDPTRAKGPAQ